MCKQHDQIIVHVFPMQLLQKEPDHPAFNVVSNSNGYNCNLFPLHPYGKTASQRWVSVLGKGAGEGRGSLKASGEHKETMGDADAQRILVCARFAQAQISVCARIFWINSTVFMGAEEKDQHSGVMEPVTHSIIINRIQHALFDLLSQNCWFHIAFRNTDNL